MPISLEPDKRFPVVLDCDKDKPAESRPTFFVRSQTMRGHQAILDTLDKWNEPEVTVSAIFATACDELQRVVIGVANMGGFEVGGNFQDLLSYNEARELLRKIANNTYLDPDEKKS